MLRITLYKHCILNETYANVFSMGKINNETILEKYLATLDSKTFEIDKVYQENSGQFVFDYDITSLTDIYDYNYMKVETVIENEDTETVKILRYCFIQEITLKNELVYLSYEEDMWHSYIEKIVGINESYLDKSRIKDYGNTFKLKTYDLPFEYKGNKKINISTLIGNNDLINAYYDVIMEVQYYTLNQEGIPTERNVGYFLVYPPLNIHKSFTGITDMINMLESKKSSGKFRKLNGSSYTEYNYEIGDIYIIPEEFNMRNNFPPNELEGFRVNNLSYATGELIILNGKKVLKTVSINNNFKNISFGTFSSAINITSNGNNVEFDLILFASPSNVSFKIECNNSLFDITNDFSYEIPIESLTSEKLSQLKISRELKVKNLQEDKNIAKANLTSQIANEGTNIIKSGTDIGTTWAGKKALRNKIKTSISSGADIVNSGVQIGTDIAKYNAITNKLNNEIDAINQPIYTSISGSFGNYANFVNSMYGIILFSINSENDNFVKKAINNLGYNAYEFISNINLLRINDANYFIGNNINYNVISFASVSCYGSFARNTAKILNGILESGVKIWYNENLQEDNYQVG